ncbi:MAG: tryptophan synthase subunit alpha [Synergistaceae bacterium]|jgi:tryptophan synthase alpha chain|nr:tryptophan synthase subunit alpha [Synergistaceae bacterium]
MSEKNGRYARLFDRLKKNKEGAFIPFVMLGDPTREASFDILRTLADSGADALELGIPFSDPIADGPVIQTAAGRALGAGATPAMCFDVIKKIRERHPVLPIGLLVYANLVVGSSPEAFYRLASESGVDSVLIADAPLETDPIFARFAERENIDTVYVVPPNADDDKLVKIARVCRCYTYFLGRSGVTGADREMRAPDSRAMELLRGAGAPPIVVGFGISRPEHVRSALMAGADGAISGSATVAIIEKNLDDPGKTRVELANFVRSMKDATIF